VIEVRVSDYMMVGGIAVQVTHRQGDGPRSVLKMNGAMREWEEVSGQITTSPPVTLALEDGEALALLDALLRHYQGASDMHTVRSDLLHERGRVDKLTDAMIRIASKEG
jgi:hypothetical protein